MIMVIVSKGNKPDAHVLRDQIETEFVVERDEKRGCATRDRIRSRILRNSEIDCGRDWRD